jgi:hypothetical protein
MAAVTVVQRIQHVYRITRTSPPRTTQARQYSEVTGFTMKGTRGDR